MNLVHLKIQEARFWPVTAGQAKSGLPEFSFLIFKEEL